ncbi:glycoside hydrolase family 3 C-terminal domain-containing protein [Streptomyces sp. YIM 98790]|uniref:beta-glucosidase n=1 Tax=Streptomyces sp. YIM 98790 TaxID=2689077 RepID=UPI0028BE5F78|nr:glycoside hydrolase family 3 C-terminal domain-containing protein [Streptomyces sp. YIM 98790]
MEDLLARLAPEERLAMLHQFAPPVDRLGLAAFRTGQEALHGVAWMGPATVFPQAVGLGATWNDDLVRRVGEAVGREARAMRAKDPRVGLNVWAPVVNQLRHPLWGRNEEGYAEDPVLTAAIATAYTRGLRGNHPRYWRTAPVLKHWLAHNHETARDTASTSVPARVLHEYELPAFRGPVRAGAVAGVMPAYNLVNGRPNHLSPLLESELRQWTDQPLVVCSDAGAPSNIAGSEHYYDSHEEGLAAALRAGVDSFTDHGEDSSVTLDRLRGALDRGLIGRQDVDRAVRRLLAMRFRLGEFDPGLDPYRPENDPAEGAYDTPEHRALALEAAEQAVVLLKNAPAARPAGGADAGGADEAADAVDGRPLLPLPPGLRLAVVGPLADETKLDWYSGALLRSVSPLDGLRGHPAPASVTFAEGTDLIRLSCPDGWLTVPDAEVAEQRDTGAFDPALLAGRTDLPPLALAADPDRAAQFALADWGGGVLTLRAENGHYLSVAEDGFVRASARQPGGWVVQETFTLVPDSAGGELIRHRGTGRMLTAGPDGLRLAREDERPTPFVRQVLQDGAEAVAAAAAGADAVVVVAGNDPHINGRETEDRTTLALPPQQDRLWRAAHAVNPRTVLVLTSSCPYAVTEAAAALPALLWTAHGGQAAGTALARVLHGETAPGGRLPQTWYAADADLPDLLDYDLIGSRLTYLYYDGEPLFPFGHGLSYTSFRYDGLTVSRDDRSGTLTAEVSVTNTGDRAGEEVVQLYVRAVNPGVPRPHRALAAYRRVRPAPGATERITFTVDTAEALGFWDVAHSRWTVEGGEYEIQAGASSRDIRRTVTLAVPGDGRPAPRPVRTRGLAAAAFDEQSGAELVDLTRTAGDAVRPARAGERPAVLRYRRCDLGSGPGVGTVRVEYSADGGEGGEGGGGTGRGRLELRADGRTVAAADLSAEGGAYRCTTAEVPLTEPLRGVVDLEVLLHGTLRLARLGFAAEGERRPA